jgi:hypothetical protein
MRSKARRRLMALGIAVAVMGTAEAAMARTAHASSGCDPIWTDPVGDAYQYPLYANSPPVFVGIYQPQLDLTRGTVWQSGGNLVVRIHVVDMEMQLPAGRTVEWWESAFDIGGTGVTVSAEHGVLGDDYAVYIGYGNPFRYVPTSGAMVTGPDGYAEVDVPLSLIGSPAAGTVVRHLSTDAIAAVAALEYDLSGYPIPPTPLVTVAQGGDAPALMDWTDHADGGGTTTVGATCP